MKIGPREQIILSYAAVVVVMLGIGAFLVWPQYQQLGVLDDNIASAKGEVASAKGLLATREDSKNRAAETDARWLRLGDLVPDSPDLPSFIVELQDAAFASGVQIISVTPATPVGNSGYYSIPMDVAVIGTWADTVDFLQRLMKLDRGVRIVSSASAPTNNTEQATKENESIPDYAEQTTLKLEAYMIPSSAASSSAAPAQTPGN